MSHSSGPPPDESNAPKPGPRGRKVRVDFRRNTGKRARDKTEWTRAFNVHGYEKEDHEAGESVRAKGALSRRRTIIENAPLSPDVARLEGVVAAVRGSVMHVEAGGRRWLCHLPRVLRSRLIAERMPITVGDRVRIALLGSEGDSGGGAPEIDAVIEEIAPRQGTLLRRYDDRLQVIAANVDQSIIISAIDDPPLRPHLIDRFLVAAHQGGLRPVIVINKADFEIEEESVEALADVVDRYTHLGYQVLLTSAATGSGVDALRDALRGKVSVFVGKSGVGKSSLLNAVQPGLARRVGEVSNASGRGQHTTTVAELIPLAFGGYVVDTPGIRQFALAEVDPSELEAYFPEIAERVSGCKFSDCRHVNEIGCAILSAVAAGEIHPERHASYVRMRTQEGNEEE